MWPMPMAATSEPYFQRTNLSLSIMATSLQMANISHSHRSEKMAMRIYIA